jgi:hypothetical protein
MITNQQSAMALSLLLTGGGLVAGLAATDVAAQPFPEDTSATDREIYIAPLKPLNDSLTEQSPLGLATIFIRGDELRMYVIAEGLPPGMAHLQHYHGFTQGNEAVCPTDDVDANGDGVVDLRETEATSGVTLVPFHDDPASLEGLLDTERFPVASSPDGVIDYRETVSVQELEAALQSQYDIGELNVENRVVFIHGVAEDVTLPDSAASIADVPASTTLPIACGEFTRID